MFLVSLTEMTQLEQAITTNLLTVSSDTTVAESILQMSAARASCSLKDDDDQLIWLVTHKSLRHLLHPVDLLRSQ